MGIGAIKAFGEVICLVLASVVIPSPIPTGGSWEVTEEWAIRYDGNTRVDIAYDMAVDSSGNIYVTGSSVENVPERDIITIAYDTDGNERWVARYDGPASGEDVGSAITMGPKGNIYVTGRTEGIGTDGDITVLAYDPSGNMLWEARHDRAGEPDVANAIETDSKGNVYVTGWSRTGPSGTEDYATVAYDSSGNELWSSYYNYFQYDQSHDLVVDSYGNVYVTGKSEGIGAFDLHYATVAYDSSGNELWAERYDYSPDPRSNRAEAIALDSRGNIYVTGTAWGNYSVRLDYVTVAYNRFGAELWVAGYNSPYSSYDQVRDIAVGPEDNIYVTGDSWDGKGSQYETTVAYDSSGNQLWEARFLDDSVNWGSPRAITVDGNGTVYVMGDSYSTVAYDSSGNKLWAAKYDNPTGRYCLTRAIGLDAKGNVYITGYCDISEADTDYVTVKYSQKWTPKVEVDIDPDTLNLDSKGRWITAYIGISGGSC
jgi:hypothetical protein